MLLFIFSLFLIVSEGAQKKSNHEALGMLGETYDARVVCQMKCVSNTLHSPTCMNDCFMARLNCAKECHGSNVQPCFENCFASHFVSKRKK